MDEARVTVTILIGLLLVASAVAMATKWVRVPYTLALVVVGLLISPWHFLPVIHISPDLILLIFLPALLFEAAWNLNIERLKANLVPVLLLAVVGVVLAVGITGVVLREGAGLPWASALLFGAMISATDPVSVIALFRRLKLPARLTTIVEGESLFNDGTAVVVFRIVLAIAISATVMRPEQMAWYSVRELGIVIFGGLGVGATVGLLASTLTSYFDDHLLEITLTTIAAYGSFLLGESLNVSPVIAVLITGLVIGNYGRRTGMSATTQVAVNSFWEYAAFVVNSLMFLLIGLEVQLPTLLDNLGPVLWGVAAVLIARACAVYLLMPLAGRWSEPVPARWRHVLFWGGMRGALSIALALSLPAAVADQDKLKVMIFGVVIFSLLAQGLTMAPVLKRLRFPAMRPAAIEFERLNGRLLAAAAAVGELDTMRAEGLLTDALYDKLAHEYQSSRREAAASLATLESEHRYIEERQLALIRRRLVRAEKARLADLRREGLISEETETKLDSDLEQHLL